MGLMGAWTETINGDCVRAQGSTDYSYIFQAPVSLAAILMVRDARNILFDQLDAAAAARGRGPYIVPAVEGAMWEADFSSPDVDLFSPDVWPPCLPQRCPAQPATSDPPEPPPATAQDDEAPPLFRVRALHHLVRPGRRPPPPRQRVGDGLAGSQTGGHVVHQRGLWVGPPVGSRRVRPSGANQGDTTSPWLWAVTEGEGGGGVEVVGESGSSVFINSYRQSPHSHPPSCHSPRRFADHPPNPPALGTDRTLSTPTGARRPQLRAAEPTPN